MQATMYSFTARGREYKFTTREDYLKAFSSYLIVDSRRENAGEYITEEMLLSPEVQLELNLTNSTKEDK